jgi:RNA-binding protein 25
MSVPTELMGVPFPNDEPRTKSERCTKVYVGKIPSGLSDYFLEQLFLECGPITSWRNTLNSSGKPLGFGFVEFQHVEGMLRCLRLLNGLQILGNKLVVRVDMQTEYFIKEWSDLKRAEWERKRWDGTLTADEEARGTWEDNVVQHDEKTRYNIQFLVHNFEQNREVDPGSLDEDREHPRERDREKRLKAKTKDTDRKFKEREKEWMRREETKDRERIKEHERDEQSKREHREALQRDLEYDSDDEGNLRRRFSRKFAKDREERKKLRQQETEEDALDARKEFERMFPGVATTDEKLQQAKELERRRMPENAEEYHLGEHNQLQMEVNLLDEAKVKPTMNVFELDAEEEQDPLFSRKHKPLELLEAEEDPEPVKQVEEVMLTEEAFQAKVTYLKACLEKIPTKKADLYTYPVDWNVLAQKRILDRKLGPFVSKLLTEYLGQEERNLVHLVVRMVVNREEPAKIQEKVEKFLDEDAEVRTI